MDIKENEPLAPYTTFKIGGTARWFCVVENQADALRAFGFAKKKGIKTFVLGGGSNILVSDKGFDGLVIKVVNKGIEMLSENTDDVLLKVASGEVWDDVVKFAVKNNWWGIENLSHIPGSTGAIAVQNVGAYGQEASQVIESVTVFDKETHDVKNFKIADFGFGYRQSIFNTNQKGKYVIFEITFKLSKIAKPNLEYRDLKIRFKGKNPLLNEIRQAIIEIRNKKFPFPVEAKNGNAGSFFKNPVLSWEEYQKLEQTIRNNFGDSKAQELRKKKFVSDTISAAAEIVSAQQNNVKVPAAFLIELCGLNNLQSGGAAINQNQPLVIINQTGTATAKDVLNLAGQVKQTVLEKTGIGLKFEPELIGFE
jgi:UDP-N-acetylmuramate dehydrogenase